MTTNYTHIDSEVLGRMLQMAKQDPNTTDTQLAVVQMAVEERKRQLDNQLSQVGQDDDFENRHKESITIYEELITLEPDNYEYYKEAGWHSLRLEDYNSTVAFYTSALQLVGDDPEEIWELYNERARSHLKLKDFIKALEDSKMALRYRYLVPSRNDSLRGSDFSSILSFVLYQSLVGMEKSSLAEEIDTLRKFAVSSNEGLGDELIAEFFLLLNIPHPSESSVDIGQISTFPRMNVIKQSISDDPTEVRKRQLRVQYYREEREACDYSTLLQIILELTQLEPDNYQYQAAAGDLYRYLSDYKRAIEYYTAALPLVDSYAGNQWWFHSKRNQHISKLYERRAYCYEVVGNYQKVVADCEKALRFDSFKDDVVIRMIISYQKMGKPLNEKQLAHVYEKCFERSLETALSADEYRRELRQEHDYEEGVGFVDFSESGVGIGYEESIAQEVRQDFGGSLKESEEKRQQQEAMLKKLEELFGLMQSS